MTTISAKIIADSISKEGVRLTTMELRYPKFIHGELMTHRVFSRNASSSRAVPVGRLSASAQEELVFPLRWGSNKAGMQSVTELEVEAALECNRLWAELAEHTRRTCQQLSDLGLHKQWANRPMEWFTHINVLVSSTEWSNFFALRLDKAAQPEMQRLALAMYDARGENNPKLLQPGEWHLPYLRPHEVVGAVTHMGQDSSGERKFLTLTLDHLIKISVARCARVSYLNHDNVEPLIRDDLVLYDRLMGSEPLHASPAEHQATPDVYRKNVVHDYWFWEYKHQRGNFYGWRQYRKTLPNECVKDR